jgi:hypothetical protein
MRVNQNFSTELGLYPKINPKHLSSKLAQDRLAIDKLSAFETRLGTAAETRIDAGKTMSEIDNKNQIEEQFISSAAFLRTSGGHVREITAEVQFRLRIIESFDPATQERYRSPCKQSPNKSSTAQNRGKKDQELEWDYKTSSSLHGQEACAQQAKHDQNLSKDNAMNCKLIPCTPSDERQETMVQVRWLQHEPGSGSATGQGSNEEKLVGLLKPQMELTCSADREHQTQNHRWQDVNQRSRKLSREKYLAANNASTHGRRNRTRGSAC